VQVAAEREATTLGAAVLAGLGSGRWRDERSLRSRLRRGTTYEPAGDSETIERLRAEWRLAVRRALVS
jgi:glycerol kinase